MENKSYKQVRITAETHKRILALIETTGQDITFVVNAALKEYLQVRENEKSGKKRI